MMGFEKDFLINPLEDVIIEGTKNHIKAQIIEYYLIKPNTSFKIIGDLFGFTEPTISAIVSQYFQYTGPYYEILVLKSKV
jgi:hypothetical protein